MTSGMSGPDPLRVCVLPSTFDAAGMYRLIFPAGYLSDSGRMEVVLPKWTHHPEDRLDVFENVDKVLPEVNADVYVFQQPLDLELLDVVRTLKDMGKVVLAEADDDFRHLPPYHPALHSTDPNVNKVRNRDIQEQIYDLCDGISVSTPSLAESYSDMNVRLIRNRLHWQMWEPLKPVWETPFRRVRVGWMGGLEWRSADLDLLRGVIGPWLAQNKHVEFVAAGDGRVHDYLGIPEDQRVTTARIPFRNMDLPYITAVMDVVLVPLADNKFNEGKSYLRGMECGAVGIPCIATPTSEYRIWCDGDTGMLATRPQEWRHHLDVLTSDHTFRHEMGHKAREKAREHTIERSFHEWGDWWEEAGNRHHADRPVEEPAAPGMRADGAGADGAGRAHGGNGQPGGRPAGDPKPARAAGADGVAAAAR